MKKEKIKLKTNNSKFKTQNLRGLTLIEVLLSMVIISLMMGAVVIIYTGALRNWNWMDPKLLLQQEGTIAMNKIERQLKKAGSIYSASDKSVAFSPLPLVTPEVDTYTVSLWRFDEGSGTDAFDETRNNNANLGTGDNQPDWVADDTGISGDALEFDGVDDYINCGSDATLSFTDKLTLEAWIRPDSGSPEEAIVYKEGTYRLYINTDNKLVGSIYYSGDWHDVTSASSIVKNSSTWTHVSLIYDKDEGTGAELKLYINGHNVATANHTNSIASSVNNLYIGYDGTNNQYPFNGVIDEVRVSNNVRRTKVSWEGEPEDKIVLEVSGISHQLNDECNTDTLIMNYYDEDYNEVTDTTTQENRNSIRIVKVLLGLEKDNQKFSLENTIALRKETPAEGGGGGGWAQVGKLPDGIQLISLLSASDGSMYAGASDMSSYSAKVFKSEDGETWTETSPPGGAWSIGVFCLAESPITESIFAGMYSPWGAQVISKTTDGGATWTGEGPSIRVVAYSLLAASNGYIYAGTYSSGRIWRSKNDGDDWTEVASLGGGPGRPFCLLEDSDRNIYSGVVTGGTGGEPYTAWIYKSTDEGDTWSDGVCLAANHVECLLEDSDGNLYAGTQPGESGPPPSFGGVFKSTDSGVTWNQIGGTLDGGVNGLIEASDGNIYAVTRTGEGGKIYKSGDGGESWTSEFEISGDGAGFGSIIEFDGTLHAGAMSGQDPDTGAYTGEIYKKGGGGGGSTNPYIYQWEEIFE
ncbi:MAG: LamG-like jellyroll fold domain-containing protein [Candidatus Theseobacter exili]|nr:LamG-like jellyroll fold domain-containing protein [Candidatus Theseobacter exili]